MGRGSFGSFEDGQKEASDLLPSEQRFGQAAYSSSRERKLRGGMVWLDLKAET